ncbi:XrtA/PEP-CTERM system TPR-repeat protein PrsT [Motiliproteus sp. MSK22-1]|uniref:XrtA/PEP-CTERM system TPR-repeat protein PrsT n=1 Tax=Motiliproteus sp. MSK22-1 TaxID=1897630 RepID=UPI0009771CC3|nr:XrtA/PEP-CTERM system TPR-repeat protein PrsT [Motiliproteus sp. MSK22-1]OMH33923.1 hypothetical protein BGP75_13205 [Motiliproteus sp. MSK22-1]
MANGVFHPWQSKLAAISLLSALSMPLMALDLYQEALDYKNGGESQAAIIQLKNLLQDTPEHQQGRTLLGKLLYDEKDFSAAEKELARAIELGADSDELVPLLVQSQLAQRKLDQALVLLEQQWSETLKPALRWSLIGSIKLAKGKFSDAEQAFYQSLQIADTPRSTLGLALVARARQAPEEALGILEPIIDNPEVGQDAKQLKVGMLLDLNRADEALPILNKIIEEKPEFKALKLSRARAYLMLKEHEKAREDLNDIPEQYRGIPLYLLSTAMIAMHEGDFKTAHRSAEAILQQLPNHPRALLLAGSALYMDKEYQNAEKQLLEFVKLVPGNLNGLRLLAASQQALRKPDAALQTLQPVLQLADPDARSMAIAGHSYLSLGEWDKGEELLSRALEKNPNLSSLRKQLIRSQIMGGRSDSALEAIRDTEEGDFQNDSLRVVALLQQKDFASAHSFLEQRIKSNPDQPIYFLLQGMVNLRQGDPDKARASYQQAIEVKPGYAMAHMALGRIELSQNRMDKARENFQQILTNDENHLAALMGMAFVADKQNDDKELLSWLNKAKLRKPDAIQPISTLARFYTQQGEIGKAKNEAYSFYLSHKQNPDAAALYATTLKATRELVKAEQIASSLAKTYPNNSSYLRLYAETLRDQNKQAEALEVSKQIIERAPDQAANLMLHADLLFRNRQLEEALSQAEKLWEVVKNPVTARLLGYIHLNLKQHDDAVKFLEMATEGGGDPQTISILASAYQLQGNSEKAIKLLSDRLQKYPDEFGVRFKLATIYQSLNQAPEAIQQYEKLLTMQPENPVPWNNLAWLYQEQKDDRSIEHAREALRLAPDRADIKDTLGWILLQYGEIDEAVNLLKEASFAAPKSDEIRFHLAKALVEGKQLSEAKQILNKLIAGNSPFKEQAKTLLSETN